MHDPKEKHLQAVQKVLQYLKATVRRGLLFQKDGELTLEVYTDSDYAGSPVDRRSSIGYCMFLRGNLVTWRSKKHHVVARSSAEAEFRAMDHGISEVLWLSNLDDLRIKRSGPIKLYCDDKSAITIAHNLVQHDRTKYIEIDRHFTKEEIESGLISTPYVPSCDQLEDVITKGLLTERFQELTSKLGMEDIHSPA